MVWPKFAVWLLGDKDHGVIRHAKTDASKKAILDVVELYEKKVNGEEVNRGIWIAARLLLLMLLMLMLLLMLLLLMLMLMLLMLLLLLLMLLLLLLLMLMLLDCLCKKTTSC